MALRFDSGCKNNRQKNEMRPNSGGEQQGALLSLGEMTANATPERSRQGELGQFFTPKPVAEFMASMFNHLPPVIKLLDAGAGTGELAIAFANQAIKANRKPSAIEATLYEVDDRVLDALLDRMRRCQIACEKAQVSFRFKIHHQNFIEDIASKLSGDLFAHPPPIFDAAIANPPYRKINSNSQERLWLRSAGIETSNLYTGFLSLICRLLLPGGQMVALTPRSFCNGPYFRPFRESFLNEMELHQIHLFESREAAFKEDNVLQENIIFHGIKGKQQPPTVLISSSSGKPGDEISQEVVRFKHIVHPDDREKFIHIPSSASHHEACGMVRRFSCTLESLGLNVSTGPVVDFRLKQYLRQESSRESVPLLYPSHFNGGTIHWPNTGTKKPNSILFNAETEQWLIPKGFYLLTKRFTSKEERKRLVACVCDPALFNSAWLGLENHLNYFHQRGSGLPRNLVAGLFIYLNSSVLDQYFRSFSGHTQVNATDIRKISYPRRETLEVIGKRVHTFNLSQAEIDQLMAPHLHGG